MTPLLHTKAQAAKRLGVSPDVLHRLVVRGELATVAVGGDERIPDDELVEWVRLNKRVCLYDDAQGALASGRSTSGTSGAGDAISAAAKRKRPRKSAGYVQATHDYLAEAERRFLTSSTDIGPSTVAESVAAQRSYLTSLTGPQRSGEAPD